MDYQTLKDVASQPDKDSSELLAALTDLASVRREMDEIERDLIQDARDSGASWARIATALGLASRQAAEQRMLRLQGESRRDPGWARWSAWRPPRCGRLAWLPPDRCSTWWNGRSPTSPTTPARPSSACAPPSRPPARTDPAARPGRPVLIPG